MARVRGRLSYKEVQGSLRVNLGSQDERFWWFLRGGISWTWYRLNDVVIEDTSGTVITWLGRTDHYHAPVLKKPWTWLPNAWSCGIGGEVSLLTLFRKRSLRTSLRRTTVSLRWDLELYAQRHVASESVFSDRRTHMPFLSRRIVLSLHASL